MSAAKRRMKPLLLGSVFLGLAIGFYNRHMFFPDVGALRAQEEARYEAKRMEVMEMRMRLQEDLEKKKKKEKEEAARPEAER